jgi:hypothetical protein
MRPFKLLLLQNDVNFQKEMKRGLKLNNEAVESEKKCLFAPQVENIK